VALDASGNVQASTLYGPYGSPRYTSGTMPGSYGFTGQRSDAFTGLDYYVARYYDPVAGQFVSADTAEAGLNRYAYVAGNPVSRIDPSGQDWWNAIANVATAVTHTVTAVAQAVAPIASTVLDATTGIPLMISDVQTLFDPHKSLLDKVLAGGDLVLNVVMDATMVIGVGEGMRTAYMGLKIAAHVGEDVAVHVGEDAAAHAAEHAAEHAGEDAAEHAAQDEAEHACTLVGGALSFAAATLVATPGGEKPIAALKVGDQVTAYDPATGKTSTQTVQATFITHDTDLLDVTLRVPAHPASKKATPQSGATAQQARAGAHQTPAAAAAPTATKASAANSQDEVVHTTANHPWYTADHGWQLAGVLLVGEPVMREDGTTAVVVALRVVPGAARMWDLTVSNVHTFAVGTGEYVVHNNNCGPRAKGLLNAMRKAGADVSHVTVGVGTAEDGALLVSLNERAAEEGATDLTDKAAENLKGILQRPGWAKQGMRYVGPEMLRPAGPSSRSLLHAERYLMDAGAVADTVEVSRSAGSCGACLRMMRLR
jgi:RHS repeat-associated protein